MCLPSENKVYVGLYTFILHTYIHTDIILISSIFNHWLTEYKYDISIYDTRISKDFVILAVSN